MKIFFALIAASMTCANVSFAKSTTTGKRGPAFANIRIECSGTVVETQPGTSKQLHDVTLQYRLSTDSGLVLNLKPMGAVNLKWKDANDGVIEFYRYQNDGAIMGSLEIFNEEGSRKGKLAIEMSVSQEGKTARSYGVLNCESK